MSPRTIYYVVRPGLATTLPSGGRFQAPARLVPLVAVDQLPAWVGIVGVPRELTPEQAAQMIAIASDSEADTAGKTDNDESQHGQAGQSADDVFEVHIVTKEGGASNAMPAVAQSPTVKAEVTEETARPVSLTPSPDVEDNDAQIVVAKAKDTIEAKENKAGEEVAHTDSTMSALLASPHLRQGDKHTDGALSSMVDDMLANLSETSLCAILNHPALVDDLIDIDVAAGQAAPVPLPMHGLADEAQGDEESDHCGKDKDDKDDKDDKRVKPTAAGSPLKTLKAGWPPLKRCCANAVRPCRRWCRTGFCPFGDSCRYAHVLPQTPEGLAAINMDRLPTWWTSRGGRANKATTITAGITAGTTAATTAAARGTRTVTSSQRPPPAHRTTRSNSSTASSGDNGPYLNQFSCYKTPDASQIAPHPTQRSRAHSTAVVPTQTQTQGPTRNHKHVFHPFMSSAMQTSHPSRTYTSRPSSRTGTAKDGSSSDTSAGSGGGGGKQNVPPVPPHLIAKKKLHLQLQREKEMAEQVDEGQTSSAPPVQEVTDLVDLVDL
ncbi:hypothetical protein HMPREF1624_07597 [Sporothrix schenckii ATCC 58251]|uniref:C3H1-type domain-containing protein n=1 Tax=Sporothrix schenckii (strain ATCC 58251 / de Perez 2211183) TaxID=1391915 RepID=U7PMB4_SPOS1|nr:hypothetical protein HMPREF1624_07597 [Sporothrix schenckii ATCC 58251]